MSLSSAEILNRVDIVDVIKAYIPLTKVGDNYKAVCCFHNDHTPSLSVSPRLGIFKCFVCEAKGNAASFIAQYEDITYYEALSKLAKKIGRADLAPAIEQEEYKDVLETNRDVLNYYHNLLLTKTEESSAAIEFLKKAIKAGFRDLNHILKDEDFDYIKRDKRFRKLTKNQDVINKLSMDALKEKVAKEFPADQGFLKTIDHENRLVYATNLGDTKDDSREILNMLRSRIENYAKAQWRQLFKKKPKYYITVAIPKKQWFDQYKRRKGFPAMVGGWYNPADKFLIAGTMGHTLTHEFTHAMHFADMEGRKGEKNMHIWFTEGIATCFEDCKLPERSTQKPEPIYNNRVRTMVMVLENQQYRARLYWNWRKFFSQDRRVFMSRGRVGVSYSMSRCIALWLYRTKRLKKYYELYR